MQGKRKKKKRKEAILGIVLDGKAYSAPFALCVPVTDTRARAAAVCVCSWTHPWCLSIKVRFRFSKASLCTALSRAGKAV